MKAILSGLVGAFLISCSTPSVVSNLVRVPAVVGNGETYEPFALDRLGLPSMRYQQVFAATEFLRLAPDGVLITEIAMHGQDFFLSRQPLLQFNLSTSFRSPDSLSPVFAENTGPDERVVYGPAPLTWASGPYAFSLTIPLTAPFEYYPIEGNLLLDIRNYQAETGCGVPNDCAGPIRAEYRVGDDVSRVFAPSVDALSGSRDTYGLVVLFTYTPIPEPAGLLIFSLGVALSAACWHKTGSSSSRN
jgi:hypothetical protein